MRRGKTRTLYGMNKSPATRTLSIALFLFTLYTHGAYIGAFAATGNEARIERECLLGKLYKPYAEHEVKLLLIEPRGVLNTGHEGGERTAVNDVWI
jgi:hypothetical protein